MKTLVKILDLKDIGDKRAALVKPIKQFETDRQPHEYRKSGIMGLVDHKKLPKIKGMEFRYIETEMDYRKKQPIVYLTYAKI